MMVAGLPEREGLTSLLYRLLFFWGRAERSSYLKTDKGFFLPANFSCT